MLPISRTVNVVLAGAVTVTGCGGGGGGGASVGAAAAVVGESAASCRDLSALGGTFVLAVCFTGPASGAGVAGCGAAISAPALPIWSFTRLTPFVFVAIFYAARPAPPFGPFPVNVPSPFLLPPSPRAAFTP